MYFTNETPGDTPECFILGNLYFMDNNHGSDLLQNADRQPCPDSVCPAAENHNDHRLI